MRLPYAPGGMGIYKRPPGDEDDAAPPKSTRNELLYDGDRVPDLMSRSPQNQLNCYFWCIRSSSRK